MKKQQATTNNKRLAMVLIYRKGSISTIKFNGIDKSH